jgi:Xaa-Pro aminopeptidase
VHHNRYDGALRPGDALLLDAGCELHGYVSDVTRTWPVSPRFSPHQRAVYDAVHAAHAACIAAVRPGASLASLHALSVRVLSEGIASLGLMPGATAAHIARGPYFRFFPHALGHPLGLDTHDTPDVATNTPLQAGCVITVEPGLYVWPDAPGVPDAFRGIGVRIEDDVLVTEHGCEVLSAGAPSAATDVEDWAQEAREDAAAAAAGAAAARRQRRAARSGA